jgi:hypothetical protein
MRAAPVFTSLAQHGNAEQAAPDVAADAARPANCAAARIAPKAASNSEIESANASPVLHKQSKREFCPNTNAAG